ncbi:hypothetical protein [Vagococcus luciliae]|uniref:Uncharacterized protein n=1 Tax=Vagococcus luciliae TaxID=2920380 RepID=A0ABY5NXP7_9ENTE|nr:hypothetical protein [Vagococcus luciliae]UUV98358.1 hypothetical protein G314FT_04740 [Vagococcus luciliae]
MEAQRNKQPKKPKKLVNKVVVIIIIVVVLVLGVWYFSRPQSNAKVSNKETQVSSTVSNNTKQLQVALDAMKTLFVNGDHTKYRTDITDKEFSHVSDKIKKLDNSDVKTDLENKLEEIKKSQNQEMSSTNSN